MDLPACCRCCNLERITCTVNKIPSHFYLLLVPGMYPNFFSSLARCQSRSMVFVSALMSIVMLLQWTHVSGRPADLRPRTERGYVDRVAKSLEAAPTSVISRLVSVCLCESAAFLERSLFSSSYTMNCIAPCETCTSGRVSAGSPLE